MRRKRLQNHLSKVSSFLVASKRSAFSDVILAYVKSELDALSILQASRRYRGSVNERNFRL